MLCLQWASVLPMGTALRSGRGVLTIFLPQWKNLKTRKPTWGAVPMLDATSGVPKRRNSGSHHQIRVLAKTPASCPYCPFSATAPEPGWLHLSLPGEQADRPSAHPGTKEGMASLLIGINGNENYKASPVHLWCPGGWDISSVLGPPHAGSCPADKTAVMP